LRSLFIPPVRQSIDVPLGPHEAFDLFTKRIAEWWPYKTHFSRGGVETLIFEPRLHGELKEVCTDGVVHTYGRVRVWDPPRRVVITWMVAAERNPPTEVEVRFTPTASGCRLDLEHRGFEAYGDVAGEKARTSYNNGWPGVLQLFLERARASGSSAASAHDLPCLVKPEP
jgi:uncharacterized protein YndB with AHSA1/START domain